MNYLGGHGSCLDSRGDAMKSDDTPPVDVAAFRETMREAGIEEIVEPTLLLYVQEAKKLFEKLPAALNRGDAEATVAYAHALKSSSLNIRTSRLAGLLEELEGAARAGALDTANEVFVRVQSEYDAVIAYLATLRRDEAL
jgi:HPt (histidine-containing phosphotransfer) domain-containing protein